MIITFPCSITIGDSIACETDVELSEKEYNLLKSKKEKDIYELSEDDDLNDLRYRVVETMIKREVENIKEDPKMIENWIHDDNKINEIYDVGFNRYVSRLYDNEIEDIVCKLGSFKVFMSEIE